MNSCGRAYGISCYSAHRSDSNRPLRVYFETLQTSISIGTPVRTLQRMMIIAGDIGGTKTNLGLFDVVNGGLVLHNQQSYPSRNFKELESIVEEFMSGAGSIAGGCFCGWRVATGGGGGRARGFCSPQSVRDSASSESPKETPAGEYRTRPVGARPFCDLSVFARHRLRERAIRSCRSIQGS